MDLGDVMDEIATQVRTISSLAGRTHAHPVDTLTPPSAVVGWPEDYTFDATYGRGTDRMTLPLVVVVGRPSDRTLRDRLAGYCAGSGDESIKQVVEAGTYTAFDVVTVQSIDFDIVQVGGADHLAALFSLDIAGPGTA